jgi:hypothetical protein
MQQGSWYEVTNDISQVHYELYIKKMASTVSTKHLQNNEYCTSRESFDECV